jgi:hypothetical protein
VFNPTPAGEVPAAWSKRRPSHRRSSQKRRHRAGVRFLNGPPMGDALANIDVKPTLK